MRAIDVIRGLGDPSPCFLCENLTDSASKSLYRVPVRHIRTPSVTADANLAEGRAALAALPEIESTGQLRAIVSDGHGHGLWVPQRLLDAPGSIEPGTSAEQAAAGSLLIFPPAEWGHLRDEFADWQFDGVEAAFEGLPYTFEDIVLFAGVNFSPDRWFLVLRGPMAGNVCWWTHDGDSVMHEPWALDIRAWADRIFADKPEDTFGGVIRFAAADSIDPAPDDAELYPIRYLPETPEGV